MILEEAGKLYTELTTKLTNEIIAAVAAMKAIQSLASQLRSSNNNSQNLDYENDNAYQTEEARCNNNQSQIYNGNQEQLNE